MPVELRYNIKVDGESQLRSAAERQAALRKGAQENTQALNEQEKATRRAADALDSYSRRQEQLSRASFKRGETYDPGLIDEARLKAVAEAHRELDRQIEQSQLSQLRGVERLNAERKKSIALAKDYGDPALVAKAEENAAIRLAGFRKRQFEDELQLFRRREDARQQAANRAKQLAEREAQRTAGKGFSPNFSQISGAIENPGSGGVSLVSGLAGELGGAAIAASAIAVALAAAASYSINLVAEAGKFAEDLDNSSQRLGITNQRMLDLAAGAKIVGVNIKSLEGAGRTLSAALEEPGEVGKKAASALKALDISRFGENGQLKEPGQLIDEVLQGLGRVESLSKRIDLAGKLLPRGAAKELLPYIQQLKEVSDIVHRLPPLSPELLKSLNQVDDKLDELGLAFERFRLNLAGKIAPIEIKVVTRLINALEGGQLDNSLHGIVTRSAIATGLSPVLGPYGGLIANALTSNPPEPDPITVANTGKVFVSDKERARRTAAADAFNARHANSLEGLESRRSELQKDIRDRTVKLSETGFSGDRSNEEGHLNSSTRELRGVEERIKQLHKNEGEYDRIKSQLDNSLKQASQFELTGLEKITAEYNEQVGEINKANLGLKKRNELLAEAAKIRDEKSEREAQKQRVETIQKELEVTKALIALGSGPGDQLHAIGAVFHATVANADRQFAVDGNSGRHTQSLEKAKDDRDKQLLDLYRNQLDQARQHSANLQLTGVDRDQRLFEINRSANPFGVFNQGDEEQRARDIADSRVKSIRARTPIESSVVGPQKARQQEEEAIAKEEADRDERLLEIRLQGEQRIANVKLQQLRTGAEERVGLLEAHANAGDELATAARIFAVRKQALLDEFNLTKDRDAYNKASQELEYERVKRLVELRRQEAEKFKSSVADAVLALQSGGGKGLASFIKGIGTQIESKVIGNLAGIAFDKFRDKIPQIGGQHELDANGNPVIDKKTGLPKQTTLGKILAGTPLGERVDPLKLATDENTVATRANTEALLSRNNSSTFGTVATAFNWQQNASTLQAITKPLIESKITYPTEGDPAEQENTTALGTLAESIDALNTNIQDLPLNQGVSGSSGIDGLGDDAAAASGKGGAFSGLKGIAKIAAAAGAVGAGVAGITAGIHQGGARGALGATSSALGSAAAIAAIIPGGQLVALGLGIASGITSLVKGFLPDPRAQREKEINKELAAAHYNAPNGLNITETTFGKSAFTNARGGLNIQKGAPMVELYNQILGIDPLHPNRLLSDTNQRLGAGTSDLGPRSLGTIPGAAGTTIIQIHMPVSAMDSQDIMRRSPDIASALSKELRGTHRIGSDIRRMNAPQ